MAAKAWRVYYEYSDQWLETFGERLSLRVTGPQDNEVIKRCLEAGSTKELNDLVEARIEKYGIP